MSGILIQWLALAFVAGLLPQEKAGTPILPTGDLAGEEATIARRMVLWKEGTAIPLRIPVAAPGKEFMSCVSFPEEGIETAVAGWKDGDITAVQKRGLLFLRLARKSEGQLSVIGASGTHYLLTLKGVENPEAGSFDDYLKILKKEESRHSDPLPKRANHRPSGALELIQAMRLGLHPEGVKILRAKRELAYESPTLEIRLVYVYDAQSYRGMIYEVKNLTEERQVVDSSHLRGQGTALILTALRENVIPPQTTTRLYAVTWKD
jgi:hypothetical protein